MYASKFQAAPVEQNEPGYVLGGVLLAVLILPQLFGFVSFVSDPRSFRPFGQTFLSLYIALVGVIFLASYYFSHKSFLLRWFAWLCEKGSFPASRKMAFFYFALCVFLSIGSFFSGKA